MALTTRQNPLKPLLDKIPAPLFNKYFLVLLLFAFWMVFITKADVLTQWKLHQALQEKHYEKKLYLQKIEAAKEQKRIQEKDPEKFAREKYYMSKDGEDVFIIE